MTTREMKCEDGLPPCDAPGRLRENGVVQCDRHAARSRAVRAAAGKWKASSR